MPAIFHATGFYFDVRVGPLYYGRMRLAYVRLRVSGGLGTEETLTHR